MRDTLYVSIPIGDTPRHRTAARTATLHAHRTYTGVKYPSSRSLPTYGASHQKRFLVFGIYIEFGPNFSRLSPLGHILWTSSSIALRLFTLFEWIWSTGLFGLFGRLMHTSSYGIVWHFRSSYRAISSSGISNGITAAAISCLLVRR